MLEERMPEDTVAAGQRGARGLTRGSDSYWLLVTGCSLLDGGYWMREPAREATDSGHRRWRGEANSPFDKLILRQAQDDNGLGLR